MAQSVDAPKPPPPSKDIPTINKDSTTICVDCQHPFEFPGHEEANKEILNNPYVGELRKAMYWQDTLHQFQSEAHYDNCDFDGATAYIDKLLQEVGKYTMDAQSAQAKGEVSKTEEAVRKAFFALGQALHAVQDFYAHSNYVEMRAKNFRSRNEIPLIEPWTDEGKKLIKNLQKDGLVSGVVWWGTPKQCKDGTLSHSELAKDSNETKSGQMKLPSLENHSQYMVALYLARKTSKDLVVHALKTWPILKAINGPFVAFDTLIDRRGI